MTDPFGTETVPKLDLLFFGGPVSRPDRERIDDTVSRFGENKRSIRHNF